MERRLFGYQIERRRDGGGGCGIDGSDISGMGR